MSHGTFEITFYSAQPGSSTFPVTVIYRPPADQNLVAAPPAHGAFRYDLPAKRQLLRAVAPREYGLTLGRALFVGKVGKLFDDAVKATPAGQPLHVLLALEDERLRELRWERLCGPLAAAPGDGWDFLALNQRTALAVYVAGTTHQKFPPVGLGQIRVLLVVASPDGADDAPGFDVARTVRAFSGALEDRVTVLARQIDGAAGPPTLDGLLGRLTAGGFTVLHVVAHGGFPRGAGDFCLILEKEDGSADRIPGESLIEALSRLAGGQLPYLTFLSACESSRPGSTDHDRFADTLARKLSLPAVVGMADAITPETAADIARAFYSCLLQGGRPDVALAAARAGLTRQEDVLVPVLISQLGGRPLFDKTVDAVPTDPESIRLGLAQLGEELLLRAPELHKPFTARYSGHPPGPDDPDWQARLDELNNWSDEALGVSFNALCQNADPVPGDYLADTSPFTGMRAIGFEERRFFKAREDLVKELTARLAADRALAVVGPSGSGKSSVVFAGVLPALGLQADGFVAFAPGADPIARLDEALTRAKSHDTLLVVDQFEELFTHQQAEGVRADFIERLKSERERRRIVITMRSEFRERLRGTWLWELVADGRRDILPMPADDLRRAIEEQAAVVGLRFEADLISLVIGDVGEEPGRMPLLQHTLRELWRRRRGVWLKTAEYRALGGVHRAVARTADAFVTSLTDREDHRRVTDIFLRLSRVAEESDLSNQTRCRVRIVDLVPAGEDERPTRDLLNRLANEYLVITSGGDAEVAHEALLRHWGALDVWVRQLRPAILFRQTLSSAAGSWDRAGCPADRLLHRGKLLDEALQFRTDSELRLNTVESQYLNSCQRECKRQAAQGRWTLRLMGLTVAAAVGLALFAAIREHVNIRTRLAQEQKNLRFTNARRLAAQSLITSERPGLLPLLLAVEAVKATQEDGVLVPEADTALLRAIGDQGGLLLPLPAGEVPGPLAAAPDGRGIVLATTRQAESKPEEGRRPEPQGSVYDIEVNKELAFGAPRRLFTVNGDIHTLTLGRSGRWLVAETNRDAYVHDLDAGGPEPVRLRITPENSGWFYGGRKVRITEDNRWVVIGVGVSTSPKSRALVPLQLRRLADGKQDDLPKDSAVSEVTADGRWLVAERGGRFTAYDLAADTPSGTGVALPPTTRQVTTAGGRIAVVGTDGQFGYFDPARPDAVLAEPSVLDPRKCSDATLLSPDGRYLITRGGGAWWVGRAVSRGAVTLTRLAEDSSWPAVRFSPRGDRTAVSSGGRMYLIHWPPEQTAPKIDVLPRYFGTGGLRAFSPDGGWLVTNEEDTRTMIIIGNDKPSIDARLWPLSRLGTPGADIPLRGGEHVNEVVVDSASRWVVTGGRFKPRLYPLRKDDLLAVARRMCDRNLTRLEWAEFFPSVEYRKTFDDLP